jgi:hypothetical protein
MSETFLEHPGRVGNDPVPANITREGYGYPRRSYPGRSALIGGLSGIAGGIGLV